MKEHPILFKGEMVRAILDGKKTQTRRIYNAKKQSKWNVGDKLWVREAWCLKGSFDGSQVYNPNGNLDSTCVHFAADRENVIATDDDGYPKIRRDGYYASPWKPSIHMPRWASRLTLEIVSVCVCKLHPISEKDAKAEGVNSAEEFEDLWIRINGQKSWDENPYVYRIEFRRGTE